MAKVEQAASAPARARVGLPIVPDGSRVHPLLLRLPDVEGGQKASCNNGCRVCLTLPSENPDSAWETEVRGRHVVIRDREPTLRRELTRHVSDLRKRGPATISLLTNGRMLSFTQVTSALLRAGVDRFIVKLFGLDAETHDAHTREPGSFDQACRGMVVATDLGADVTATFPLLVDLAPEERRSARAEAAVLSKRLTGKDPCEMPEPEVESHGGEYHYDLITLRGKLTHPYWVDSFFPMVHVNTGPVCNIRCTYCNVHGGDDQRLFDQSYIESMIDASAKKVIGDPSTVGVPTIDFIGGEPTLHPALPDVIRYARGKGFPQVTICSNGVLLLRPGYLDSLVDAGLTGVRFSFHDHRAEMANELADVAGLGSRYVDVAKLLLSRKDLRPHVYRILLSSTIDALGDYLRWLAENNQTGRAIELTFGMPSMRGRLFDNRHLYPSLEGLREKVSAAVELADELGIELLLHHSPGCLYPAAPERSACLHITTKQVDAMTAEDRVMNFEGDARYGEACEGCSGKTEGCHGLPSAYFDADPVSAEAWLRPLTYRAARE